MSSSKPGILLYTLPLEVLRFDSLHVRAAVRVPRLHVGASLAPSFACFAHHSDISMIHVSGGKPASKTEQVRLEQIWRNPRTKLTRTFELAAHRLCTACIRAANGVNIGRTAPRVMLVIHANTKMLTKRNIAFIHIPDIYDPTSHDDCNIGGGRMRQRRDSLFGANTQDGTSIMVQSSLDNTRQRSSRKMFFPLDSDDGNFGASGGSGNQKQGLQTPLYLDGAHKYVACLVFKTRHVLLAPWLSHNLLPRIRFPMSLLMVALYLFALQCRTADVCLQFVLNSLRYCRRPAVCVLHADEDEKANGRERRQDIEAAKENALEKCPALGMCFLAMDDDDWKDVIANVGPQNPHGCPGGTWALSANYLLVC